MPRRRATCRTSSVRSTVTKPNSPSLCALVLALVALAGTPAGAARDDAPPITTILASYDRAMHGPDVQTIETIGTLSGEGLTGTFHTWHDGDRERDDEYLGPRSETTLMIGDRVWVRNSNGNVQELTGVLLRRARTNAFVDSEAFVKAPQRVRFTGFGDIDGRRTWNIEVTAPGGDPETLWVDVQTGRPLRTEYLDGDGPTDVDLSDWRTIDGMQVAFHAVTTDGDHAFDTIQQTTSIVLGKPIAAATFAMLEGQHLIASGVQTVPLIDDGASIACNVGIAGKTYTFLIDSGSGNVVLDARAAKNAGLAQTGALEVRGATRAGGMQVAMLSRLTIGSAALDDLVVSTLDLGSTGRMHIDGILGYPFFAAGMVQLDFAHHVMRFGPPGSFAAPGDRIALDTDREIPEAVFQINGALEAPFIVDTGDSASVLLYGPFVALHPALAPQIGTGGSSFIGIGGSDGSYGTRFDAFRLGTTTLVNQPGDVIIAKDGAFADRVDAGNVGLGVLRNFTVTFDYAEHLLYLAHGTASAAPGV